MMEPTIKPGYRTSEGWATFAGLLIGALTALGIVDPNEGAAWYDQIAGFGLMLASVLGYQRSRAIVKAAR